MLNVKKGDKVILKGFTGIKLGVFTIDNCTKKTITIVKKNGDEMIFDRKTGKQVNVVEGKEKYANSIMEDDGSYVAPSRKKKEKKVAKKSKAVVEEPETDEAEDEEEEVKPAPKKRGRSKKAKETPAPASDSEEKAEADEDDSFEEFEDDDDFEEE